MPVPKARLFIWILCLTAAMDLGARTYFEKPEKKSKTNHLGTYFNSNQNPDLMVLGSSVALGSSFHSDAAFGYVDGKRKQGDTDYLGAHYLKRLLRERAGLDLNCMTAASVGAMASDAWLTVSKAIEFKKVPKVIVYEFVSRDFFDASMPELGTTPTFKKLASCHPSRGGQGLPNPVMDLIDWTASSPVVTATSIILSDGRFLTDAERFRFSVDSLASATSYVYKNRSALKEWLTDQSCVFLQRRASIHESIVLNLIEQKKKNPFASLNAIDGGAKVYDTKPQEKRYENELVYYTRLLKLCRDNSISLIVVNMPVRSDYPPKVPGELKNRYPKEIFALAREYGADVIDLQRKDVFQDSDFLDLIHLNEGGCVKLVTLLGDQLSKHRMISTLSSARKTY